MKKRHYKKHNTSSYISGHALNNQPSGCEVQKWRQHYNVHIYFLKKKKVLFFFWLRFQSRSRMSRVWFLNQENCTFSGQPKKKKRKPLNTELTTVWYSRRDWPFQLHHGNQIWSALRGNLKSKLLKKKSTSLVCFCCTSEKSPDDLKLSEFNTMNLYSRKNIWCM